MNEKMNKTREIIEERFVKLHEEVYHQMMNEEKNGYDPEIMLPMCSMMDNIPMKNKYSVDSKDDDTFKKMKRREKRLSTLEEHLKNNHSEEAKTIIQKQYCVSITEVAHLAYELYMPTEGSDETEEYTSLEYILTNYEGIDKS